jgi:hypothetical protein
MFVAFSSRQIEDVFCCPPLVVRISPCYILNMHAFSGCIYRPCFPCTESLFGRKHLRFIFRSRPKPNPASRFPSVMDLLSRAVSRTRKSVEVPDGTHRLKSQRLGRHSLSSSLLPALAEELERKQGKGITPLGRSSSFPSCISTDRHL